MNKFDVKKFERYLPSKQFTKIMLIMAGVVIIILVIGSLISSRNKFSSSTSSLIEVDPNATVRDLVNQDSNQNGIPDWQETLWGLDPKGNGAVNKATIEENEKKAGMEVATSTKVSTPTDELARTLLSTILALQQSGGLTPDAVAKISDSISSAIKEKRVSLDPIYSLEMIKTGTGDTKEYMSELKDILTKAQDRGMGSEFSIIAKGLDEQVGNEKDIQNLLPIAQVYIDFGKNLTQLSTPKGVQFYVLSMANSSNAIGVSLQKLSLIYTDAISGMVGLDDYLKYMQDFDSASGRMAKFLKDSTSQ